MGPGGSLKATTATGIFACLKCDLLAAPDTGSRRQWQLRLGVAPRALPSASVRMIASNLKAAPVAAKVGLSSCRWHP